MGYSLESSHSTIAFVVPCSAHSLNLIGSNVIDITQEETILFFTEKRFSIFLSVSTYK